MKKLALLFILTSSLANAQDDEIPELYYSVISNISDDLFTASADLSPLLFGVKGTYLTVGVGGGFVVANISNKFSVSGHFNYFYGKYSTNRNKVRYANHDYENKKIYDVEASLGYAFNQVRRNGEMRRVKLKVLGNKEYVSDLPCDEYQSHLLNVGFNRTSFFSKGEANISNYENYILWQEVSSLSVGYSRKVDVHTVFMTDKFGEVKESVENYLYADLLFNIQNEFPQILELAYNDPSYPLESSGNITVPAVTQNLFRDQFKRYPVGVRIGWVADSRKLNSFKGRAELGLYPGSYSSVLHAISFKMELTYRLKYAKN